MVQHLSPHQESILHELLQRHTSLPVERIADNTEVQPNRVYVIPAGYELTIRNNLLRLVDRTASEGWPETINRFFQSLAEDRGENAAGIILSGAGYDGTEGARAIRDKGGAILDQDLESASQSSMPFSIIDAGLATAVLSPDLMPGYLLKYFRVASGDTAEFEDLTETLTEEDVKRISRQLRRLTGSDFADYKLSTMRRQIARRMSAVQLNDVNSYLALMDQQPSEAHQLVKRLLIHVTSFFRDPASFETLRINGLLPLLKTLSIDDVFRVWVPGCASGEEAVSIAILIHECLRQLRLTEMEVRIFATDMNRDLIQRARTGIYPLASADSLTASRFKDHFISSEDGFQVRAHISRMIVWAEHNLVEHPPFSNLYLVSCRNVLIYYQSKLQERIRALFQFALRPEGLLFLGSSEAIPEPSDLFTVVDSRHKIYRRMPTVNKPWMRLDQPLFARPPVSSEDSMSSSKAPQRDSDDYRLQVIKEILLSHYNATCVLVDELYQIRYAYGEIDRFLRLVSGGDSQRSILSMARQGLDSELTIALYEAFETDNTVARQGIWFESNGEERLINIIVKPVNDPIIGNRYRLVIFEVSTVAGRADDETVDREGSEEWAVITRLREELQQARQALQSSTHALQAKSEELTSSMEEIGSANEEIQTTNEELRTSKEELESMNEELNTLNSQLTNQNHELTHANNALYNFLQSTAVGVIFLDQDLAIREYTQAVTQIFRLRKSDIGRPLSEIKSQLVYDGLIADAARVLDTLENSDHEVSTTDGDWYKVDIRPYRTMNNIVDGLVLTFSEITLQKQAQHQAEQTSSYVEM
ncbi:MAG: PAS domain-containing protein [Chloroflexi bacterium]|nr:PAS domain-containing protein [Chloroflexota bacterium]